MGRIVPLNIPEPHEDGQQQIFIPLNSEDELYYWEWFKTAQTEAERYVAVDALTRGLFGKGYNCEQVLSAFDDFAGENGFTFDRDQVWGWINGVYDVNPPWETRFKFEKEQGKKLNLINAAEILSWNPPPRKWNVENLIPLPSIVMLSAYAKMGKTTFFNLLIIAILQGKPFLGFQTRKSPVLLLAVEENERDVCDRLKKFGLRSEDPLFVHPGFCKNDSETLDELKAVIKEKGIEIIFIDTLSRFWQVINENDNAEITGELGSLLSIRDELGCTVVPVHHDNKGKGEDIKSMRGGSALAGIIDQGLMLKEGKNKNQRILKIQGRFNEYCPSDLTIELRNNEYIVVESNTNERKIEDRKTTIIEFLKLNKDQSVNLIAKGTGVSDSSTRKILKQLVEEKKVSAMPSGKKGGGKLYKAL